MRIFGSITDLFNLVFKRNGCEVTLKPHASTTFSANRTFSLPNADAATELVGKVAGASTDNEVVRFDSTTGMLVQACATPVTISDGGIMNITATTTSTDKDTGCLTLQGGAGIEENLNIGGVFKVANTTDATTKDTGCVIVEGGIGVEKAVYSGTSITATTSVNGATGVFSTSTTSPIIYGSTAANGDLELVSTTNGTKTTSVINFGASGAHGSIAAGTGVWTIGDFANTTGPNVIAANPASGTVCNFLSNKTFTYVNFQTSGGVKGYAGATAADCFQVYEATFTNLVASCTQAGVWSMLYNYSAVGGTSEACYIDNTGRFGKITSALRFKDNVVPRPNVLNEIEQMQGLVSFTAKNDETNRIQLGIIAEDVASYFPELCTYDNNEIHGVRYERLGVVALQGVKELLAEVKSLKARIEALENA